MPIFEFKCPKCQDKFETVQSFGAQPPLCEKCDVLMEKTFSQTAPPIFKGSTTYKSRKPRT